MKRRLIVGFKAAISLLLLAIVFVKVDWSQFAMPRGNKNAGFILCGIIGGVAFNLIKFLKWQNLISTGTVRHSYWDAVKSYMIGNSLGLATPLRVGEFGRALYFAKSDRPRIISMTVIDRALELLVVLLFAVAGIFVLIDKAVAALVGAAAVLGLAAMFRAGQLKALSGKMGWDHGRWEKAGKYLAILGSVNGRTMSVATVLSALAFFAVFLELYFLVAAFEAATLTSAFLAGPLITLSSIMPVSFMGLGVREGISAVLFAGFGVSSSAAVAAAFLLFVINNVLFGLMGIVFLWRLR